MALLVSRLLGHSTGADVEEEKTCSCEGKGRVVLCLHSLNSAEELYRGLFNEFNWLKGNSNHLEYAAVE